MLSGKGQTAHRHLPERVDFQDMHKVLGRHICEQGVRTRDAGVGKDDVQPSVSLNSVAHDSLDGRLVGGVEFSNVNLTFWVERFDFLLVVAEELVVKVADIDSLCAVLGVLMRCSSSYAQRRIRAYDLSGKFSMFSF